MPYAEDVKLYYFAYVNFAVMWQEGDPNQIALVIDFPCSEELEGVKPADLLTGDEYNMALIKNFVPSGVENDLKVLLGEDLRPLFLRRVSELCL